MVLEHAGAEVPAEPAASPGRRALGPEHGHHQDGEVPAVAGQPGRGRPRDVQRPVVAGHDLRQQLRGGTGVHAGPFGLGQRHPVGLRQMLVNQQALRGGGEARNVAGQDLQQGRVAAR